MKDKKTLTQEAEPDLLTDAVRLSKSDFIALYVQLGYEREDVGPAWHNLRVSAKGHELIKKLKPSYMPKDQPLTFISDVKEEVEERQKKKRGRKKAK